jgi:predicted nucleotidyltransferase
METGILAQYRQQIIELASKRRVQSISVFGSMARGDEGSDSDIDLLVEPKPGCSLLDLISLKHDIEDLTGRSVDVVSKKGLSPYLADQIIDEAIPL